MVSNDPNEYILLTYQKDSQGTVNGRYNHLEGQS